MLARTSNLRGKARSSARPRPYSILSSPKEEGAEIVVEVNGKVRTRITAPFATSKDELESRSFAHDKVKPFIDGKRVMKVITVSDKLVNIVVK